MNEIMMAIAWLEDILSSDSALSALAPGGVHRSMADPGTSTPYIVIGTQSPGQDALTANVVRVLSMPLFQVKAVGPAKNTQAIVDAEARLDVVLGGEDGLRNIAIGGGYMHACYRENPLQGDQLENGALWTNIGGLYRIQIQQSS